MSNINVMVDLETLGTSVDSVILSIGAVVFDIEKDLGEEFYEEINPDQERKIDIDTMKWWMTQETKCPINGTVPLYTAVLKFDNWLRKICGNYNLENIVLWANGTNFDISLLEHAIHQYALKTNWKYNNVRDYRTIVKTFESYGVKPEGLVKHNAVEDARWQAKYLCSILKNLKEHVDVRT